jgi:FlaA1/EpsC-like NDP-sugar epimerase
MTWQYFKKRLIVILFDGDNHLKFLNLRYLPRWIVVLLDTFVAATSLIVTYFIIENIAVSFYPVLGLWQQGFFILLTQVVFFFVYSTYSGVIRHSTFVDIIKIALACFSAMVVLFSANYAYFYIYDQKIFLFPFLFINMAITFTGMLSVRVAVKSLYSLYATVAQEDSLRILIIGVDDDTIAIADAINTATNKRFILAGFVSMKKSYGNLKILEAPIFKFSTDLFATIGHLKIDGVLMVGTKLNLTVKNRVVDLCLAHHLKIYSVPVITDWDEEQKETLNIRKIQIEDLLDRSAIALSDEHINSFLTDKVILVTGGAGSIGSEIVRQISQYNPKRIIVIDQAESPLHDLELELRGLFPTLQYYFVLGDIRNEPRLTRLFATKNIEVVFHAAAYKHVPMIERNPREAVQVNMFGTATLANLALKFKVAKFVMVSTDKAVNPTNVMGASKRAAEIYVQALQAKFPNGTRFITTRFGNVLGSNGSVIPHFQRQIEQGGPVTVTHEDIIRYFMTIPEACQLVLQAGTMGTGGEVYVFDMGKPVRIMDLAEKMIKLCGYQPYVDIDIQITGLRPGEKLYEELLTDSCETLATHHKKIMIAKDEVLKLKLVTKKFEELAYAVAEMDDISVVTLLKELVPEYLSKNSVYEILDNVAENGE